MLRNDESDFRVPGMMQGDFPEEFLKELGFVKAEIPLYTEKIVGVQPNPDGPVGLRLIEKYLKSEEK
jgi:hypothetical protein